MSRPRPRLSLAQKVLGCGARVFIRLRDALRSHAAVESQFPGRRFTRFPPESWKSNCIDSLERYLTGRLVWIVKTRDWSFNLRMLVLSIENDSFGLSSSTITSVSRTRTVLTLTLLPRKYRSPWQTLTGVCAFAESKDAATENR